MVAKIDSSQLDNSFFHDAITSHPLRTKVPSIFKTQAYIYENRYVLQIAKLLLGADDFLSVECIDKAKKELVIQGPKATSIDKHLFEILDDLKDPTVQVAFKKIGRINQVGDQIVRATLCLEERAPITPKDVRVTALASFLGRWRQLDYHSCYTYSVSMVAKALTPNRVFEEYNDILEHGALKRDIDGKECSFLALPKMVPFLLGKELLPNTKAKKLWEYDHLARAFQIMGASKSAVDAAITAVARKKLPLTLQHILVETQVNKVLQDKAIFQIAAMSEMPLSRIWNNAIAGLLFTPLTAKYEQIITHDVFKIALLLTLMSLIKQSKSRNTSTLMAELIKHIPRIAEVEIQGEDFSDILPHFRKLRHQIFGLSEKKRTERIYADKELLQRRPDDPVGLYNALTYVDADLHKGKIDLTAPHFASLARLRIFVEPSDKLERHSPEAHLYLEKSNGFIRINTAQECGKALQEIFIDILKELKATAVKNKIMAFSPTKIAQEFHSFFTPLFSCDASGGFDPLYDNTPWSFMLAPSRFDSFWKIYLAKKNSIPSQTIQFSNNPNAVKEFLHWAEQLRKKAGTSAKLLVPAKYPGRAPIEVYPGHAITLTPNHPTMIPRAGQTVEAMMQEKMQKVLDLPAKTASRTIKEAKRWAIEYLNSWLKNTASASTAVNKLRKQMVLFEKNSALKLQDYLKKVIAEVLLLTEQEKLSEVALDEFSIGCFREICSDIPDVVESSVIQFGDSLLEHEPVKSKISLPVQACFYPNCLTDQWSTFYFANSQKYSYTQPLQPSELTLCQQSF